MEAKVKKIVKGNSHTIFLMDDGTVYGVGYNYYGQLGQFTREKIYPPTKLDLPRCIDVVSGGDHTLFLTETGEVLGTGENFDGQLGASDREYRKTPILLTDNAIGVFANGSVSVILKEDDTVYACGENPHGCFGLGHCDPVYELTKLPIENVVQVALGEYHIMFRLKDGTVYGAGANFWGQLGIDNGGKDELSPVKIPVENCVKVATGWNFTLFLTENGDVYGAGDNYAGQCGIPDKINVNRNLPIKLENIVPVTKIDTVGKCTNIFAGGIRSVFQTEDGKLLMNSYILELDDIDIAGKPEPIDVDDVIDVCFALNDVHFVKKDGSYCILPFWGINEYKSENDSFKYIDSIGLKYTICEKPTPKISDLEKA